MTRVKRLLFVLSVVSMLLKMVRRAGELSESIQRRASVGSVGTTKGGDRASRVKRLLLGLLVLDLALMIGAVVVALKLKRSRESVGDEESDEFDFSTIFEGVEFESRAAALREGAWLAYFGGGELDLSGARLDPEGATLRVRAVMGGGEIVVPSDCRVEMHSRGLMGGVNDESGQLDGEAVGPLLVIEASTLMGGFHIVRGETALRRSVDEPIKGEAATT